MKTTRFVWRSLVSCALLASSTLALAQSVPPADVPAFKVGDRWKYQVKDVRTNVNEADSVREIIAVSATQIEAKETEGRSVFTPGMAIIESARTLITSGESKPLNFPLVIGKKWDYKYSMKNKTSGMLVRVQMEAEVVSFEKVKVPAGEFDAFKVNAKGFWNNDTTRGNGRIVQTLWFAPATRSTVKSQYTDGYTNDIRELLEFQLQP